MSFNSDRTIRLVPMKLIITTLLIFVCIINFTSTYAQDRLPRNLDDAISYFKQHWSKKKLEDFRAKPENKAVVELHSFGTGLWIRNTWIRGNRDTVLTNFFSALGVHSADDMSSIILTSLHRSLNNKKINLHTQVENCKAYWNTIMDCEDKATKNAVLIYNKYKTGRIVTIYMPVDNSDNSKNAVQYGCPTSEWTFNPKNDLLIKAIIVEKYFINNKSNVFFKVQITNMNRKDTKIFLKEVKVGDTTDFSLSGLKIR